MIADIRPIIWIGSSRRDLRGMPKKVRQDFGQALYAAQQGETDPAALHVFQKQSKSGIATPKPDMDLIRRRYAEAERHRRERQN